MKKGIPRILISVGIALVIFSIVLWKVLNVNILPQNSQLTTGDWIAIITFGLGLGSNIKGWMDLFKKEKSGKRDHSTNRITFIGGDPKIVLDGNARLIQADTYVEKQYIHEDPAEVHSQLLAKKKLFALYVKSELEKLNWQQSWNDNHFIDLTAEIERGRATNILHLFSFLPSWSNSHRLSVNSLSRAIEQSPERLILLEGLPGSGKSVFLRHLSQKMVTQASTSNEIHSMIPLYINLKGLTRKKSQKISYSLIENYVLKTIRRVNKPELIEWLNNEFRAGMTNGSWFFMFDSFDEIPDILSSTESDTVIQSYADAINDFMAMSNCRAIIASREYRGPSLGWPKFIISRLNHKKQLELIKKSGLPQKLQKVIRDGLSVATPSFLEAASNTLFLSLLCEYIGNNPDAIFPNSVHQAYKKYIDFRFERDRDKLEGLGFSIEKAKYAAEILAFTMTATEDYNLGLAPSKDELRESVVRRIGPDMPNSFDSIMDALTTIRMVIVGTHSENSVEFELRRIQEYFAANLIIKDNNQVSARELLTNARWRDTSIFILQMMPPSENHYLLDELNSLMEEWGDSSLLNASRNFVINTLSEKRNWWQKIPAWSVIFFRQPDNQLTLPKRTISKIEWPKNFLHVLEIIQEGLPEKLPFDQKNQKMVDETLSYVVVNGSLLDMKWALDVARVASIKTQHLLLENGLNSIGNWTKDIVYRQLAYLHNIPPYFSKRISVSLIRLAATGELFENRIEIGTYIMRLNGPTTYSIPVNFLAWTSKFLDYASLLISCIIVLVNFPPYSVLFLLFISTALAFYRWNYPKDQIFLDFSDTHFSWISIIFCTCIIFWMLNPEVRVGAKLIASLAFISLNFWSTALIFSIYYPLKIYKHTYLGSFFRFVLFPVEFFRAFLLLSVISILAITVFAGLLWMSSLLEKNILIFGYVIEVAILIYIVFWVLPEIYRIFKSIIRKKPEKLGIHVRVFFFCVLLSIIFAPLGYLVARVDPLVKYSGYAMIIVGGIYILFVAFGFIRIFVDYYKCFIEYKRLSVDTSKIDVIDLLDLLAKLTYHTLQLNLLVDIRKKDRLAKTDENNRLLELVVVYVQASVQKIKNPDILRDEQNLVSYLERHTTVSKGWFPSSFFLTPYISLFHTPIRRKVILTERLNDEICKLYKILDGK
jgi:hypothetical protein